MRELSAYELNQLQKYNIVLDDKRLDSEIPVEYLTHHSEFRGNDFFVDESVLIPRIETEELVDLALAKLDQFDKKKTLTFADIGSGSGAIGISFAKELYNRRLKFKGYLSDISDNALEILKKNLESLLPKDKSVHILKSDLFSSYSSKFKFDIIFANLPYIPSERILTLDSSVKDYEPVIALDGGNDGLKIIEQFLIQADHFIKKNGFIFLEVDDSHSKETFENLELKHYKVRVVNDSNAKNRFWIISKK